MAGERPASIPDTSVPSVEQTGNLGGGFSQRASPEAFGSQVGSALTDVGEQAFQIAQKQQGMINESLATGADAELAKARGDIKAKYLALSGKEAFDAYPQYQTDLQSAQQNVGSSLPSGAKRAYDLMSIRSTASDISEGGAHAAQQIKQWQIDEGSKLANTKVQELLQPSVSNNFEKTGEVMGDIHHAVGMMIDPDHPGLAIDPETGTSTFADTPEGKQLKDTYQRNLDTYLGMAQINRFDTLAKQDPITAQKIFDSEKSSIPKLAQVHIEASLEPQVFNANVKGVNSTVMAEANQQHYQTLMNPSNSGSNAYNLGNVKTASGAANNTQDFVQPATPVDGVILTANNLHSKNYEGKTLDQIGHTWTSTDKDAWVKNVSAVSGISPDTVPNLNDPTTMAKLLKGIAVAEGKTKGTFSDDVISQGVTASLAGQQPQTTTQKPKPYATNPDGSPLTRADYYKTNSADIYAKGDAYAEQTMPGNLQFKHAVHSSLEQGMSTAIQNQSAQYKQDNDFIMRAFNGDFTKGKHPTSLDELSAIPNVKDVLTRSSVHSPEFVRMLDQRLLTASARGEGRDAKEYGDKFLDLYHQIHPSNGNPATITDANQLNQYVGSGLTLAGRNQLQKEIESTDGSKSLKADTYKAVDGKISKKNSLTGVQDPDGDIRAINAHYAMDKYWADEKAKGTSDDELLNPKNPKWIGNIGLGFSRTPAQVAADLRKSNGGGQTGENVTAVKQLTDDLDSGKLKGDAGLQAIKAQYAYKKISKDTASALLVKYGYAAGSQASQNSPIIPRPE